MGCCHCLHNFGCKIAKIGNFLQSFFLLFIRLVWGYLFLFTGLGKLMSVSTTAEFFQNIGIAWPYFSAYLAGGLETVGGILLILGLFSRLAALPLIATMLVALFTVHKAALMLGLSDPMALVIQPPATFLLVLLTIFVFGPGMFSGDALIKKWCGCTSCCSHKETHS